MNAYQDIRTEKLRAWIVSHDSVKDSYIEGNAVFFATDLLLPNGEWDVEWQAASSIGEARDHLGY